MAKIYALYKGDEYIADGTLEELAGKTGKKLASLEWMLTPAAKKRRKDGGESQELVYLGEEKLVRKCEICGKAFRFSSHPNKKYCSVSCRQKAARLREQERYGDVFLSKPEEERTRICEVCGKPYVAKQPKQKYCCHKCGKKADHNATRLELPYKRHKPKHVSHIEEINAQARAQHKSYGKLQAEKLLARLHEEMAGGRT